MIEKVGVLAEMCCLLFKQYGRLLVRAVPLRYIPSRWGANADRIPSKSNRRSIYHRAI